MRGQRGAALLMAMALLGCPAGKAPTTAPKPGATLRPKGLGSTAPKPVATPSGGALVPGPETGIAALTGKVKLIAGNGGSIISDHGGGIISNNGGAIISDNGGGIVSNNGSSYRLQAKAAESLLADADLAFLDAAGAPVPGPDGKPLVARTDRKGAYALRAALPAGHYVVKVRLWTGGELAALLVHDGAPGAIQDVDTASSLGAAYVLDRYVKGDQAILAKLPASEAQRLQRDMEAARERLAKAPDYAPAALVAAAEDLRGQDPTVARTLDDIRALLLGQAKLGDGLPATSVPLNRPGALGLDAAGDVLITEYGPGRIRVVDAAGTMRTRLDQTRGELKLNFPRLQAMVQAPDGTVYAASRLDRKVHRVRPDGTADVLYQDAAKGFRPYALARGADGTLYVGGGEDGGDGPHQPSFLAIGPDGRARPLPAIDAAAVVVRGLAVAGDGTLYVARSGPVGTVGGSLHRIPPAGPAVALATDLKVSTNAGVAIGPDGTVYLCEDVGARVSAFAPDGTRRVLVGAGGEAGAPKLVSPGGLLARPDGTLLVSDPGTGMVHARAPGGAWRVFAGFDADAQANDGRTVALNTPIGVAFDGQGRLLIAENGRHRLVRYADGRLETVAGTSQGFGGDGGPARDASLSGIAGVAARGDEIFVIDAVNKRLRRIGPDGTITTVAGSEGAGTSRVGKKGAAPADLDLRKALGVAVAPDGRPYVANTGRDQVLRLGDPARVDVVAGRRITNAEPEGFAAMLADAITDGEPAPAATLRLPLGLAFDATGGLWVADTGHGLVRKIAGATGAAPTIATFAGLGLAGYASLFGDPGKAGATGPAREVVLVGPAGLCADAAGNLYVGELGTKRQDLVGEAFGEAIALDAGAMPPIPARVRKIAPDGTVSTIAGPGGKFFQDPDADDALLVPAALAISADGRLAIADPGANNVRILPAGSF